MANFPKGLESTPAGEALNAKLFARGIPFQVSAIVVGDGEWFGPGLPSALVQQLYSADSVSVSILTGNIVVFEVDLTPLQELLTEPAHLREAGVIAVDLDIGPILYSYGNISPSPGPLPET